MLKCLSWLQEEWFHPAMLVTQFKCNAFKMHLAPEVIHLHSHNAECPCAISVVRAHKEWEMKTLNPTESFRSIKVHLLHFRIFAYYLAFQSNYSLLRVTNEKARTHEWTEPVRFWCYTRVSSPCLNLECPLDTLKKTAQILHWRKETLKNSEKRESTQNR